MKKDNKGFSLIELMVAIIILALVVTPLLHSFMTVMRTNAKSRRLLRTTTVAENVMEGLSGLSIETIAQQFHLKDEPDPDDIDPDTTSPYDESEFIFLNMAGDDFDYGEVVPKQDLSIVNPSDPTVIGALGPYSSSVSTNVNSINTVLHQFKERDLSVNDIHNQKYYFYMKNVKEDRQTYDVRITLDASVYRSEEIVTEADGTKAIQSANIGPDYDHTYNEDLMVNVDRMNSKTDFTWIEPAEAKALAAKALYENHFMPIFDEEAYNKLEDWEKEFADYNTNQDHFNYFKSRGSELMNFIYNNMEAHYDIFIDPVGNEYSVTFILTAYCDCPVPGCSLPAHFIATGGGGTIEFGSESNKNGVLFKELLYSDLKNIYLFYYPTYDISGKISDYITIYDYRGLNESPVNIYIIKQKNGEPTYIEEKNYKMKFSYFEENLWDLVDEHTTKSINDYSCTNRIRSNLCTIQSLSGGTETAEQIEYFLGNFIADSPISATPAEAKKYFGFDKNSTSDDPDTWVPNMTGESSNVNDYIYLKTVEVYPGGTFDELGNNLAAFDFEERYDSNGVPQSDEAKLAKKRINVLTSRK